MQFRVGNGDAPEDRHGSKPYRRRTGARALYRRPARRGRAAARGDRSASITGGSDEAEGTLVENQARLRNAQSDLERFQKLLSEGLITKQQVTIEEALVDQYRGALQANQAQVNNAKVQLGYTRVVAPIAGRLGLRQVDSGNLIRSGDANGLVVITMMRPISVLFTVPEADPSRRTGGESSRPPPPRPGVGSRGDASACGR